MNSLSQSEQSGDERVKLIEISLEKMEIPDEVRQAVDTDILQWLVGTSLSQTIIESISQYRIKVVRKPRCKKEKYIVVEGIILYLILLCNVWVNSVHVVLVEEPFPNLAKIINDDLMLWLLVFKAGAIANGGRATLLFSLMQRREETGQPAGLVLNSSQLGKGDLLKEITGFGSRGFRREKIDPVPPCLEKICRALDVSHNLVSLNGDEEDEKL